MNRRGFLQLFGAGLPAVVVAEKIGLIEKATKYFFAPKGGWNQLTAAQIVDEMSAAYGKVIAEIAAEPSFLAGIPYYITNENTGNFYGLRRLAYPKIDWDKALELKPTHYRDHQFDIDDGVIV